MQASKISLMICLGAVSVMPLVGRADDTPMQARLREALHSAEAGNPTPPAIEVNANGVVPAAPAADTTAPVAAVPATPAATADQTAPAMPAPAAPTMIGDVPAAPAPAADAAVATPPAAPDMATPNVSVQSTPAGDTTVSVTPEPAVPNQPVSVTTVATPPDQTMTPPPVMDTNVMVVAPPMTVDTNTVPMADASAMATVVVDTNTIPSVTEPMMTNAVATMPDMSMMQTNMSNAETQAMKQATMPVMMPHHPLSADQRQRLDSLTAQYKADQLTPQEYHEQRAKIIAEP